METSLTWVTPSSPRCGQYKFFIFWEERIYLNTSKDFPGSPVVRTLSFHYWGIPGWGTKIPQVTRYSQKKSKIKKSRSYGYILGESIHFLLSTYYRRFSPHILHEFFPLLGEQPYSQQFSFACSYLTQLLGLSSDIPGPAVSLLPRSRGPFASSELQHLLSISSCIAILPWVCSCLFTYLLSSSIV